jgi:hypothetical protein
MNALIKELVEQAMVSSGVEGLGGSYTELDPEKFAELILKEVRLTLFVNGYIDAFDLLDKHFGVEK